MSFESNLSLAFRLFEEGKLIESKSLYDELLSKMSTQKEEIGLRYNYGYLLTELNQVDEAIGNYNKLLQIGKDTNNKEIISQATHQKGMVYRLSGQYEKALEVFSLEYNYINEYFSNRLLFQSANYYELGYTHLLLKEYDRAKYFLELSLSTAVKSGDKTMIACSYRGIGEYHQSQSEKEEARLYFEKSIKEFQSIPDDYGEKEVEELIRSLD